MTGGPPHLPNDVERQLQYARELLAGAMTSPDGRCFIAACRLLDELVVELERLVVRAPGPGPA